METSLFHKNQIITNSTFCLRESFNISFIDSLKTIANQRASKDRQEVLNGILSREKHMLLTIENNLSDVGSTENNTEPSGS